MHPWVFGFDFQLPNYQITHLPDSQHERNCLHQNENKILVIVCITAMRLFIALDIPEEIRARLRDYIERMRPLAPDAPWVRAESLHVTLKFVGEASDARVQEVKDVLRQIKS